MRVCVCVCGECIRYNRSSDFSTLRLKCVVSVSLSGCFFLLFSFLYFLFISISSSSFNEKWSIYHGLYSIFRFERLGMDAQQKQVRKNP